MSVKSVDMAALNRRMHDRFQTMIELLRPRETDLPRYQRRLDEVRSALTRLCPVGMCIRFGSYERRTAIRHSDVDLLFLIPPENVLLDGSLMSSMRFLHRLGKDLAREIPHSRVKFDAPAISVHFEKERFELNVVPGVPKDVAPFGVENPGVLISDRNGGWITTAPRAQALYLEQCYNNSDGSLRYVARFIKFWRTLGSIPLQLPSFYVEYVLGMSRTCEGVMFPEAVWKSFAMLDKSACTGIEDPLGLSGRLTPFRSVSGMKRLASTLRNASGWATRAFSAQVNGDETKAVQYWNKVFRGTFPDFATTPDMIGWGRNAMKVFPGTKSRIPKQFL